MPGGTAKVGAVDQRVEQRFAQHPLRFALLLDHHIAANPLLQRIEALEVPHVLREIVVELRELLPLHGRHVAREDRLLAREFGVAVFLGEGDVHLDVVARRGTHELFFETRDEATRADFEFDTLPTAPLEGLAVDTADEVDRRDVASSRSRYRRAPPPRVRCGYAALRAAHRPRFPRHRLRAARRADRRDPAARTSA